MFTQYLSQFLKVRVSTDVLVEVVPVVILHSGVVKHHRHWLEPRPQGGVRGQTAQLVAVGYCIGCMVAPVRWRIIELTKSCH